MAGSSYEVNRSTPSKTCQVQANLPKPTMPTEVEDVDSPQEAAAPRLAQWRVAAKPLSSPGKTALLSETARRKRSALFTFLIRDDSRKRHQGVLDRASAADGRKGPRPHQDSPCESAQGKVGQHMRATAAPRDYRSSRQGTCQSSSNARSAKHAKLKGCCTEGYLGGGCHSKPWYLSGESASGRHTALLLSLMSTRAVGNHPRPSYILLAPTEVDTCRMDAG